MSHLQQFSHQFWGNKNKPKLLFLHGLMGSWANWRRIVKSFENHFHILAFDQRGHGKSFKPQLGYAPEDYAQDIKLILDEVGWKEGVHIVGHSMGGRNALNFTYQYPEYVEKLVIEDIGPDSSQEAVDSIKHLLSLVPVPFASKSEARKFFMNDYEDLIADNPQKKTLSQYFYTNIVELEDGTAGWRFSLSGIIESMEKGREKARWHEVEGLQVPTLLIRGDRSKELSQDVYEKMLSLSPKVQGQVINDSGHWVHFEQPEDFIDSLRHFLL